MGGALLCVSSNHSNSTLLLRLINTMKVRTVCVQVELPEWWVGPGERGFVDVCGQSFWTRPLSRPLQSREGVWGRKEGAALRGLVLAWSGWSRAGRRTHPWTRPFGEEAFDAEELGPERLSWQCGRSSKRRLSCSSSCSQDFCLASGEVGGRQPPLSGIGVTLASQFSPTDHMQFHGALELHKFDISVTSAFHH